MTCHDDYNIYYTLSNDSSPTSLSECSIIQLPANENPYNYEQNSFLSAEFDLKVHVSDACSSCHGSGGSCDLDLDHDHEEKFECKNGEKDEYTDNRKSGMFELV